MKILKRFLLGLRDLKRRAAAPVLNHNPKLFLNLTPEAIKIKRKNQIGAALLSAFALASFSLVSSAEDAPALTPVADPKPILADLQQKMSALTSVYLEFTQERQLQLFAEPLKSDGVMLIDQPGLIRWETTVPYQSILLGNPKSVAQFEFADGQWTKLKLGFPQMLKRLMDQMSLMHQGKLDALAADFTISVSTGAVTAVTLVPKDENIRAMLAALEIHLAPDLSGTRALVMREASGDLTRITFTREVRRVKFPEKTFDQTKPAELAAIKAAVEPAK
jgi:outer membrane lipoprotein-sorting protein